jgi:hypothetical protein
MQLSLQEKECPKNDFLDSKYISVSSPAFQSARPFAEAILPQENKQLQRVTTPRTTWTIGEAKLTGRARETKAPTGTQKLLDRASKLNGLLDITLEHSQCNNPQWIVIIPLHAQYIAILLIF